MRRTAVLAGAVAVVLISGMGTAAASPPSSKLASTLARSVRQAPRPGLSLSQAPAGLQAAVHSTLGAGAGSGRWSQRAELTASNSAQLDEFGSSVAISGTTAVVGAPVKNSSTGAAYVFVRTGKRWSQQAELTASNAAAGDRFGDAVAISGTTVVVGARGKNSFTGAAYVFVSTGRTWSQQAELTAPNGAEFEGFGYAVAISGTTVVVSAPGRNDVGAAYVFVRTGKRWSQQAELTAAGGAGLDQFGFSVAMSGTTALVGAPGRTNRTGAAYVFVRSGKRWSQQAALTASDGAIVDFFGYSVAISGTTAVIGAPNHNSLTGAAYVFGR